MLKQPIYLDYAATTPVDPRVAEKMWPYLTETFGNPASSHLYGRAANTAIEHARQQIATLIHADPQEIIWTSGATEANNLALKGIAYAYQNKGRHIVTCQTEHEAVLESCRYLEQQGFTVTYLKPTSNGLLLLSQLETALRPDTILVAIMHVNNETGVIQDIAAFGKLLQQRGIIFHVDAAQSLARIPIDVRQLPVDLMAFSGHKIYGPKGVGALYVKRSLQQRLQPQMQGGGQEQGLRSGTLATHQIVGIGEACAVAHHEMAEESKRIGALRDQLWAGLQKLDNVYLNSDFKYSVAGILNVAFTGIDSNALLPALRDLAFSTGSACHAMTREPSRVLRAMGLTDEWVRGSLRLSLGRFTTAAEIEYAVAKLHAAINALR